MSTSTDLESRIGAALAARAEQVTPQSLRRVGPPVLPRRRSMTPLLLGAAAASVLLAGVLAVVLPGNDRVAPEPTGPAIVLPPDVGRAWDRAPMSPPFAIDLDGDGRDEKVRFRSDRDRLEDGRVRLETTLSSDGTDVYGLVDLGEAGGVSPLEPIDADGDGDREIVLYRSDPGDPRSTLPVVLDLRDGVLVQAPASDPDLLRTGTIEAAGGTEDYDLVHTAEYWVEDGTLHSLRSVRSFAWLAKTLLRPDEYEADAFTWRLGEDGVLRPETPDVSCLRVMSEGRRPCLPGESDLLPELAPVADQTVGIGGSFTSDRSGYPFTASLQPATEDDADADLVITQGVFPELREPLRTGANPLLFATQPTRVSYNGPSVLVASGDGDEPVAHQVLVLQEVSELSDDPLVLGRAGMTRLQPVGDVPLGTGHTDGGQAFRTWLTDDGDVITAVAGTSDPTGPWDVYVWVRVDARRMVAAPLDTVCFDDPLDPATARRC